MTIDSQDFQHHIKLICPEKIEKSEAQKFINVVRRTGPDNIIKPVDVYDAVGETKTISLRGVKKGDSYWYVIPLSRNLTEGEAEKIVMVWAQHFEGDFILETSTPYTGREPEECADCVEEQTDHYGSSDIKEFHQLWLTSLTESGWRYGVKYSKDDKTHPLLMPWEQIPRTFKEASYSDILLKLLEK